MYLRPIFKTALLSAFILLIVNGRAFSQNTFPVIFGKVSSADFDLPKSPVIDSNSNAVIISAVGSIEFIGNKHDWVSYLFKKNTRIKILNKKGYDLATVKIRLFGEEDEQDKLENFHASTYNIENGKVVETKLDESNLFNEKLSKRVNEKKFTMPDVKDGSIIEYSYSITSYHYYYLPGWSFQDLDYPCLYSEFRIGVPDLLRYLTIHYGADSIHNIKSADSYATLVMNLVKVGSTIHNQTWIMKDVPPFDHEDYINDPRDYVDKLEFTVAQIYNGRDLKNISTNWISAEKTLLKSDEFGMSINADNSTNLYNTMSRICSADGDIMLATKQIYNYVRDNFTCVPDDNIYIKNHYCPTKL